MAKGELVPLTVDLIEEGRFLKELNEAVLNAGHEFARYVERHPGLVKAKGRVAVNIFLDYEAGDDGGYDIRTRIDSRLPGRPERASTVVPQEVAGQMFLCVRKSGSSADSPNQKRLTTDDGRAVDQETGEVLDAPDTGRGKKV